MSVLSIGDLSDISIDERDFSEGDHVLVITVGDVFGCSANFTYRFTVVAPPGL